MSGSHTSLVDFLKLLGIAVMSYLLSEVKNKSLKDIDPEKLKHVL